MQNQRNIRSIPSFIRGLWDWTFLNECFTPTRIRVADVDGIVERRGHFLWIEAKPEHAGAEHEITKGQRITHEALIRTKAFTVITVWGTTDTDMAYEHLRHSDTTAMLCALGEPTPIYARVWCEDGRTWEGPIDKERFKRLVRGWFQWADKNPK